MIKIMFICLGNICRSPMAEYIFKDMIKNRGLDSKYYCISRATSSEEAGNPVYYKASALLTSLGINHSGHRATRLTDNECNDFDYLVAMDTKNLKSLERMLTPSNMNKVKLLMQYAGENRSVEDPWWTDDFQTAYRDIKRGCECLIEYLEKM